jgi:hypothetical protein
MTFKIIEGFFAIVALVQGLAGSGSEVADFVGMERIAHGTLNHLIGKTLRCTNLLAVQRWRNTIRLELLFSVFRHPVCGPCG